MTWSGGPSRPFGPAPAGLALLLVLTFVPWESAVEAQRWRPRDRVLLTSFHLVVGLARGERRLYAASSGGLRILDMVSRRWELPSTAEDGFPEDEEPSALAYDDLDRMVWLGTLEGNLYSYQVELERWTREASPALGPLLRMAWLDEGDDEALYLRSPSGWFRLPRFSLAAERVPAGRLPAALRLLEAAPEERLARIDPAFASARGTLLMDEDAQRWPLTDFVPALRQGLYWLATAGGDLYLYDSRFISTEPHRFGLLSTSARALASHGSWIWFGGDGRGPRRGISRASGDLQEWRWYDARTSGAPVRAVVDMVVKDSAAWFATAEGVFRLDRGSERWDRVGGLAGSVRVHRLAEGPDGAIWAATERGLLRIAGQGPAVDLAPGPGLRAVLVVGDTLWVGGDGGLRRFLTSGEELTWAAAAPPPLGRVVDLARSGETVWAALRGGALWRFGAGGWEGPLREVAQGGVNELLRLRTRGDVLWVGGNGGAARRDPDTGQWTYLLVGEDLPEGPVWDVLPTGEHVFVATPVGVMRVDWREAF